MRGNLKACKLLRSLHNGVITGTASTAMAVHTVHLQSTHAAPAAAHSLLLISLPDQSIQIPTTPQTRCRMGTLCPSNSRAAVAVVQLWCILVVLGLMPPHHHACIRCRAAPVQRPVQLLHVQLKPRQVPLQLPHKRQDPR